MKPFVGPLMQKLEYDTSVQWPVVNIAKLEAEALAEKKKGAWRSFECCVVACLCDRAGRG